jgi:hypothetical protein
MGNDVGTQWTTNTGGNSVLAGTYATPDSFFTAVETTSISGSELLLPASEYLGWTYDTNGGAVLWVYVTNPGVDVILNIPTTGDPTMSIGSDHDPNW